MREHGLEAEANGLPQLLNKCVQDIPFDRPPAELRAGPGDRDAERRRCACQPARPGVYAPCSRTLLWGLDEGSGQERRCYDVLCYVPQPLNMEA